MTLLGDQLVVVGEGGLVLTSPDGIAWTPRSSGTTQWLEASTRMGSQIVAVGEGGIILTSPDGVTWTKRSSSTGEGLHSVTWTDNQLVAVGSNGALVTSPDGVTWTEGLSNTEANLWSVTWEGKLVALGDGGVILNSPKGVPEPPGYYSPTSVELHAVAASDNLWVAVGAAGTILTSPDGFVWTPRKSGTTTRLYHVEWTDSLWVAAGHDSSILTSPDGISWTPGASREIVRNQIWTGQYGVRVRGPMIEYSSDGVAWTEVVRRAYSLNSLVWTGSQWVAVGEDDVSAWIMHSTDGKVWQDASQKPVDYGLWSVTWTGSQFVTVGNHGTIMTSPDGDKWTDRTPGMTNASLSSVKWKGSIGVAVGQYGTIVTSRKDPVPVLISPVAPFRDQMHLRLTQSNLFASLPEAWSGQDGRARIYSIAGCKVEEFRILKFGKSLILPLPKVGAGRYLLEVKVQGERCVLPFSLSR